MFKAGDRVVCINRLYKNDIVVGKHYEVHSIRPYDSGEINDKSIRIKNEKGIVCNYTSIQFEYDEVYYRKQKIEKICSKLVT